MVSRSRRLLAAAITLTLPLLAVLPSEAQAAPAAPADAVIARWGTDQPADNEQYYFVLPDRFANGTKANDKGGLTGDRPATGFDPTDKGFYHGGDLAGVIDKLDYIQGLGTTAIWLAPVFKNRPVQGSGADVSAGYHGYWITDFTQVDPHFGSNAELKKLVDSAHRRGMKVFLDIIANHTADVIRYAENEYDYIDKATSPYKDAQGRPFDDRKGEFPRVSAQSFPYTPVFPAAADKTVKKPAWLNDPTMYHNRGNSTFAGENSEYGDFYGLDDLWTERPEVVRGMTDIYAYWIAATGIDGYRLDTVKHVDLDFWPQFSAGIEKAAQRAGKQDFFMFGEVYSADQEIESTYVRRGGLPATLDFSFQEAAKNFVAGDGSAQALADLYAKDDLYTARDTNAGRLPTFLGNHDMGRIGSFLKGDDVLRRDQLAHELMFLTRGQPVVYSGDEQGFTGPGGDKDARQDMFASKTADYLDDDLIGTERTHAVDNYDTAHPIYRTVAALGALRQAHPALRGGVQVTRHAAGGVFAASRVDRAQRVEYVVAANSSTTAKTVTVDTWTPSTTFRGIYGSTAAPQTAADGKVTITVPPLSAVALRADKSVSASSAPTVTFTSPADALVPTRTKLAVETTGDPLARVTFAAQVGDGPWRLVGSGTNAAYHDLTGLAGGTTVRYKAVVRDGKGRLASATTSIKVGTPATTTSPGYAVVHYQRPAGDYDDYGLYVFGDVDPSMTTTYPAGQPFVGEDAYGKFALVKLAPNAKNVGFIVVGEDGVKDVGADRFFDPSHHGEIWLKQGDAGVVTTPPAVEQDPGTATIHYRRADAEGWGLHVWDGAANPTDWASPLPPTGTDSFGPYWKVPLAAGATALKYIIHKGDEKDLPDDQQLTFAAGGREIWLLAGVSPRVAPVVKKTGSGGVIDVTKSSAVWLDRGTVAFKPAGSTDGKVYDLVYAPGGITNEVTGDFRSVRLTARALTDAQRARFPHLWQYDAFDLPRGVNVKDVLRGQVVFTERDATGKLLAATGVQTAGVLDNVYAAAAADAALGPVGTTLSVWAPTAQKVDLQLYDTATAQPATVAMRRDDRTGIWSVRGPASWRGKYYTYRVTAWQPAANKVVTAAVTDPYALGLSTDSTLSRIVDLADPALAPTGWSALRKPPAGPSAKIQISELSVRDFSMADKSVPAAQRGTYAAFTNPSSTGMKHLATLAGAGVTHLHLLPAFDFATIPEKRADQKTPACDLPLLPPDSEEQQKCVTAVAADDGYNWGYDPLHYTVPEGGYAVDPDARTKEFRQMVAGVNRAGLRVVMDVVYNHTSAAGTDPKSVLDQIVPGYYQRLLADGTVASSTCCANTAPENAMMGKLVVDSIVTWAREYKVDGFRFDLMGHHPKANILAVRAALDRLSVRKDGVDGKSINLYGEGWDFGEVAGDARFEQATQANMAGTGIATFNDRLRDAVRGGGPFDESPRVQGFATGLFSAPNGDTVNGDPAAQKARLLHYQDLIKVGLSGNLASYRFVNSAGTTVTGAQVDYNGSPAGYTAAPGEAITYVDAHDNEILYDAMAFKLPASTPALDRARAQSVALATTALGQGAGFVTTGSERLRSKSLDRNSYNSGDWFNQIIWDCADGNGFGRGLPPAADNADKWDFGRPLLADPALVPGCDAVALSDARYQELLKIRGSSPVFGLPTAAEVQKRLSFPLSGAAETPGVVTMTLDGRGIDRTWKSVTVVFNGTSAATTQTVKPLAGKTIALHPIQRTSADPLVRTAAFAKATGTFTVPARTVAVFVEN
ncbi:1,4-alpha-glucan branching enzyme [Paractinoplanes abujensis]|uniref:1,4-alpha-D-glucan glucanohydrolase n=1 Tax=Paractinoplanes abujensis TaxID=882441 RepID=A0A7W7D166_9ACTN|nr:pullulanase-type alpha-1,6-glucosidase [Actinoplanes abujensis]MBB4698432.1 pullulanase-type alpha-1,6-glucosidase [Actinoplanes abujensis]GID19083.1 1,4-alpha-glucan branching enzyme [Actinoplanes abujensis]